MQLILVSGLSGAGKSIALNVLEDSGYYCVDNLPAMLLMEVVDFLSQAGHERIALSIDARSAALLALPERIGQLRARGVDCRVLFIEATPEALLRRFSETRRRHPLAVDGYTLAEAIARERTMLADIAELGHHIDTSELQPRALGNWIRDLLGVGVGALTILFQSFGFKEGIPLDADWVIDARMLPNPHYDARLRPLTGRDDAVIKYLEAQETVQRFHADVKTFLERWLPALLRDNRAYVTVAIGCTGGRHRSVYLAERLAEDFRSGWNVLVRHRSLANLPQEKHA